MTKRRNLGSTDEIYKVDRHGHLPEIEKKIDTSPDRVIGPSIRSVSVFIIYLTGL
jgi:hypothetical protein